MQESVHAVFSKCGDVKAVALIDGNRVPTDMLLDAQCVIKGDASEYCIAAASIIAKVTRDRLMRQYDVQFPEYGFAQHKGYGTLQHMKAIADHGPCAIHRMTFKPIRHDD
jgi:ribonuclease HII